MNKRGEQRRRHPHEVIGAQRDVGVHDQFADDGRAEAAPEDRHEQGDKDEVVEHEQRLAAEQVGVGLVVAEFAATAPPEDQVDRDQRHTCPEEEHRVADLAAGEAVDAVDQAAAGGERPEDHGAEGADHEEHVPDFEHPALLLDHDAVQECRADQPRQESGVFDRIPAPVAAPAEHVICPATAEQQAETQEQPRDQRPAAGRLNPVGREVAGSQRRHRKREGDDERDEAEIEHRRVDRHAEVPQQRVQALRRAGQAA